jgi:hypothetical protein
MSHGEHRAMGQGERRPMSQGGGGRMTRVEVDV